MYTPRPTHLNCPWCPAQAYPLMPKENKGDHTVYQCPARHQFMIRVVEEEHASTVYESC